MRYFCTYFDHHYLPRALALHESLVRHAGPFKLWALCMDQEAHDFLAALKSDSLEPILLRDFEKGDNALTAVKPGRTKIEYYFTCTPSILRYILNRFPEVDLITYLDADLFFFASPDTVFDEIGDRSIAIIEHRFPEPLRHLEINGLYNVGWVSIRRDEIGIACVNWWRDRCIEWCFDRHEGKKFADQKYLNDWPTRFKGVATLKNLGANLAPWNLLNVRLHANAGKVMVDRHPLVFFHFHGLRRLRASVYDPRLYAYGMKATRFIKRNLYGPYVQAVRAADECVKHHSPELATGGALRWSTDRLSAPPDKGVWARLRDLREAPGIMKAVLKRDYLLILGSRIL